MNRQTLQCAVLALLVGLWGCGPDRVGGGSAPQPGVEKQAQQPAKIELPGGIVVDRAARELRIPARVAIDMGWIEQVVCVEGSRDHESLLTVRVQPSTVHAGLLLLGLEPGRPGYWRFVDEGSDRPRVERVQPEGARVMVAARVPGPDGGFDEQPLSDWLRGAHNDEAFPNQPWVFGGSVFDTESGYAADRSGSLVGLVTFGDEVIGLESIMADQTGVDAAEWEAATGSMPKPGTDVVLIVRPWERAR